MLIFEETRSKPPLWTHFPFLPCYALSALFPSFATSVSKQTNSKRPPIIHRIMQAPCHMMQRHPHTSLPVLQLQPGIPMPALPRRMRRGVYDTQQPSAGRGTRLLRGPSLCQCRPESHPDWPRNPERYQNLRDEDVIELEQFLARWRQRRAAPLDPYGTEEEGPGEVYLVGTGPGDPGLLTLRALQLMQTADVVLYDRLVSDDILRLVGPQARMVYVGKHSGFHTRSQDEIHALLLAFAEAGATVIRLKGGDPYVFGRGGEEVQYLAARGIQVHCVPGITAASGICAELGIPMTHRGVATSVRFLTGHARDGAEQELLDSTVAGAADPHTTLVVYMGLQTLPNLYQQLAAHGMTPDLPAVAVERGTTRRQRVAWGTVSELPQRAAAAGLKSPALIIIGQVVSLAPGWQEWASTGRPIHTPSRIPRHNYQLPALDLELLQQTALPAAVSTARAATAAAALAAGQPGAADEEVIRTRDVLRFGATATASAVVAPTPAMATLHTPPVPAPTQITVSGTLGSSLSATAQTEDVPVLQPALPVSGTVQAATAYVSGGPAASQQAASAAVVGGSGSNGDVMDCDANGEEGCLLPWARAALARDAAAASCGEADESCPLP